MDKHVKANVPPASGAADGAVAQGVVAGVYAGRAVSLSHGDTTVRSALVKYALTGPSYVAVDGLEADEQADHRHHGGPGKALLVVPAEHYDHGAGPAESLPVGTLGENLSTRGLLESQVRIGDVFSIDEVVVRVTQPRRPCFKLGARHGIPDLALGLQRTGQTGFYLAVLRPGMLKAGAVMTLIVPTTHGVTLAEVNRIMNVDKTDLSGIRRVLHAGDDIPVAWRAQLEARLVNPRLVDHDNARMTGEGIAD
jgi:MOSC domain-containing protein YiiM